MGVIKCFVEIPCATALLQIRNQICMGDCVLCGQTGYVRRHGYLRRTNPQGEETIGRVRFFAPIVMATKVVGERLR